MLTPSTCFRAVSRLHASRFCGPCPCGPRPADLVPASFPLSYMVSIPPFPVFHAPLVFSLDSALPAPAPAGMERFAASASAARDALRRVLRAMEPGMLISDLCALGDEFLREEAAKAEEKLGPDPEDPDAGPGEAQASPWAALQSSPSAKGRAASVDIQALGEISSRLKHIGFPTCVTPNPMLGDYSPTSRSASLQLQPGTVYKVKLAALVRRAYGYAATTVVLSPEKPYFGQPIEGDLASALAACHVLSKVLPNYFRPGVLSSKICSHVRRIAAHFGARPVIGVNFEIVPAGSRDFLDHKFVLGAPLPPTYEAIPPFKLVADCAVVVDIMLSCGDAEPVAEQRPACVYQLDSSLLTLTPPITRVAPFKGPLLPRLNSRGMLGRRETEILRLLQHHRYPFTARCLGPRAGLQGLAPVSAYLLPFSLARLPTKEFVQIGLMFFIGADKTYTLSSPLLPNVIRSKITPTPSMAEEMAGTLLVPADDMPDGEAAVREDSR